MAAELRGGSAKSLEDSFFHAQDEKLLNEFRQQLATKELKDQLADCSGIHDQNVLDRLLELNIRPQTLAALSLVPLIEVAWADGKMPDKNRTAVLEAAERMGIAPQDDAHQLLEAWLKQRPGADLLQGWKQYVRALCDKLDAAAQERLKHDLLDRAQKIAEAAGGVLGMGRVSAAEKAKLAELDRAFA